MDAELGKDHPSEEYIVEKISDIASQLYKETQAKKIIVAQIARKRASMMKPQENFNCDYFSDLIDYITLSSSGKVRLHTKVVNYGKAIKSRVKKDKPTRYRGYASKVSIAAFEIDEYDSIGHWLTPEEYEKLSEKAKQEYSYYEWDEADDWYKVYNLIVDRVDTMLGYFCRWADYAIKDVNLDEANPTADYVRLIVYRS